MVGRSIRATTSGAAAWCCTRRRWRRVGDPDLTAGRNMGGGQVFIAGDVFAAGCQQNGGTWNDKGYNIGTDGTCVINGANGRCRCGVGCGVEARAVGRLRRGDADDRTRRGQPGDRADREVDSGDAQRADGRAVRGLRSARAAAPRDREAVVRRGRVRDAGADGPVRVRGRRHRCRGLPQDEPRDGRLLADAGAVGRVRR